MTNLEKREKREKDTFVLMCIKGLDRALYKYLLTTRVVCLKIQICIYVHSLKFRGSFVHDRTVDI